MKVNGIGAWNCYIKKRWLHLGKPVSSFHQGNKKQSVSCRSLARQPPILDRQMLVKSKRTVFSSLLALEGREECTWIEPRNMALFGIWQAASCLLCKMGGGLGVG